MDDELEFSDPHEEDKQDDCSHLKYHFTIKNVETNSATSLFKQKLIKELENKVGAVQRDFVAVKDTPAGRATVLFGLKSDSDAERLLRRRVSILVPGNENARIEPTDVFKALLDYKSRKKPMKKPSPVRSRSPRASSPVLLVLFPPPQVKDSEIFGELTRLRILETPKIEHIFTDLPELQIKQFVKLTFKHIHTVEQLSKSEMSLQGKPVLLLQPSLKHDLEKSVLHATPHHQVTVSLSERMPREELSAALERYGDIADVQGNYTEFVATYCQLKSAKDALRAATCTRDGITFRFSKKLG